LANCPKCNHKLKLTDWRPECPKCGVNILYYNFEEEFYKDAKIAELDIAKVRVRWMRFKASYFGNRLSIAKFALCVLPLLALMLPQGFVGLNLPLVSKKLPLNILGAFSFFTDGAYAYFSSLASSEPFSHFAKDIKLLFMAFSGITVFALTVVLLQLLSFVSYKKISFLIILTSALGLAAQGFLFTKSVLLGLKFESEIFVFKSLPWGLLCGLAFLILIILNVSSCRRGLDVKYVEGDLYRLELARKLKHKELTLDDLGQPVYKPDEAEPDSDADNNGRGGKELG